MGKASLLFFLQLLSIVAISQTDHGVTKFFTTANGMCRIDHYAENIYKIRLEPRGYTTNETISDAVILKLPHTSSYPFEASISGDTVFIKGRPLIVGTHHNNGYHGFYFPLQVGEMIFGGGERALPLNRRGYRLTLYNNPWYGYGEGADNLNYSVPFITSSKGYGLFFDNPSKGYLDIGKTNSNRLEYGALSGELNVYVIFGDYAGILRSYYKLTGTQPLPPRWALGNLMSRFGYTSEAQVKTIFSKMKAEGIPVDAVIFDLFWFGDSIKHTLGNLDWVNRKAWPDPKRMIRDFERSGVKTILVTEPFFVESSINYQSSKPYLAIDSAGKMYGLTDFYFGPGGLIDIFRKDSRQWFWQFYKKQMENGVEAWWGDLGEPEKHPPGLYHNLSDYGYSRLFSADEVHNLYGHTWTKMLYQYYAKEYPDKRLFSLNRSGFAGSQRYCIFPWTGDVSRSWSGLRAQLPILLGMSMSGVPYVHSDAGGFAGGDGDNELYIRWLQFAAFTPIFRPHGTALYEKDPNAFSFPSEAVLIDSPYKDIAKDIINMRYGFLPYNYSLAYQHTRFGKPLMAPLHYYFSSDTTTYHVDDEFMWGDNILVAPVLQKGAVTRTFYLPSGSWYKAGAPGRFVRGHSWHTDSVILSQFPIFFREGAFVVFDARSAPDTRSDDDTLGVTYIASDKASTFQLYNDDGRTKSAIENNKYELISFSSSGVTGKELTLSVRSNNGAYTGKKDMKLMLFTIAQEMGAPKRILINNKPCTRATALAAKEKYTYVYSEEGLIYFWIHFSASPVSINLKW